MFTILRRAAAFGAVALLSASLAVSQNSPNSQPSAWAAKPDVAAFEKAENERLAVAQSTIDKIVSVKGPRTVENTLVPYDEAIRQINTAADFAVLMQQVHPDAAYRDHATAMLQKAVAVQTALSLNQDVYKSLAALDLSK